MAWGMTSPKTRMAVTDIKIAVDELTTLSKKIGNVSSTNALHRSKVTNSQWELLRMPSNLSACIHITEQFTYLSLLFRCAIDFFELQIPLRNR